MSQDQPAGDATTGAASEDETKAPVQAINPTIAEFEVPDKLRARRTGTESKTLRMDADALSRAQGTPTWMVVVIVVLCIGLVAGFVVLGLMIVDGG